MHNAGQVALAMLILKTPQMMYYMAILMAVGAACGVLSGICADRVMRHLGDADPLCPKSLSMEENACADLRKGAAALYI